VLSQVLSQPSLLLSWLSQQAFFSELRFSFEQDFFSIFTFSEEFPHAKRVLVGMTNNSKKRTNSCVLLFIKFHHKDTKYFRFQFGFFLVGGYAIFVF
tara:strand:+ start:25891 stop:26181 length:291 start_codon:yes stop_codon:yes gene_type:complete